MKSSSRRRALLLPAVTLAALAGVGLLACSGGGSRQVVAERLIEAPNDEILDLDDLLDASPTFEWALDQADELARWETGETGELHGAGSRPRVSPSSGHGFIQMIREVDFEAHEVHALSVRAPNLRQGRLRLFWAGAGEKFAPERRVQADAGTRGPDGEIVLDLRSSPQWRGRIGRLRLDLPNAEDRAIELEVISGLRYAFEPRVLGATLRRSLKVELDHDVRNAVLTPPGVPVQWTFEKPTRGRLKVAYGVAGSANPPVSFRVTRSGGDGEPVAVFEATVDPRQPSVAGRWHEATVELTAPIEALSFETHAAAGYELSAGIPAWANPEILRPATDPAPPNVILISVDTLRPDHLSLYGYGEPTSPELDAWAARRAVTFSSAVATAPWTLPSHVSILSGLDALSHGVNYDLPAPLELRMLPEMVRAAGYTTLGVTGGGWLHPRNGLHQGFDSFRYWHRGMGAESEIEEGMNRALELIESHAERPFFLFFHTYETHDPYRRRPPYGERCPAVPVAGEDEVGEELMFGATGLPRQESDAFRLFYRFVKWRPGEPVGSGGEVSEDELALIGCLYDSSIAYADRQLGRLFRKVRELGLESDTIIVLTSDHGESLGEDGLAKHAYLTDTNLLVPLVIGLPDGSSAGELVDTQVSTVDIVPTLLDLLGLDGGARTDGRSLVPLLDGEDSPGTRGAWSYAGDSNFGLSLRTDRWKYTFDDTAWTTSVRREGFYRLRPGVEKPEDTAEKDFAGLRQQLAEHLGSRSHGIRVQIESSGCNSLEGSLRGRAVKVNRIKSDSLTPAGLKRLGNAEAGFTAKPGETFSLLLEGALGELTVKAALEPCAGGKRQSFDARLRLDELPEVWSMVLENGQWRADEGHSEGIEARILLERRGPIGASGAEPEAMDLELLEQLRALGYVP
ncbi:MAG: sulfatase-like hydrolase/transferase [bacterium]|nr:sulfatase-like hydrolase/transferase [bacterium]